MNPSTPQNPAFFREEWNDWVRIWKEMYQHPDETTYAGLLSDPAAGAGRAMLWTILSALASYSLLYLPIMAGVGIFAFTLILRPESRALGGFLLNGSLYLIILLLSLGLGMFLFQVACYHWFAKALGGKGRFSDLLYLFAAYIPPLLVATTVGGLIPFVNILIGFVSFYALYIQVVAVKTVYRLTWGRAAAVVAIPVVGYFIIIFLLILLWFLIVGMVMMSNGGRLPFPDLFPGLLHNSAAFVS